MQAVKAIYKQGNIQLLESLHDIDEADLFIIVLDKDKKTTDSVDSFSAKELNSEADFKFIGLSNFFNTEEDNNVDWEDVFNVSSR